MGAPAHDRKAPPFTVGLGASPLRTRGGVRVTDPRRSCQHLAAPPAPPLPSPQNQRRGRLRQAVRCGRSQPDAARARRSGLLLDAAVCPSVGLAARRATWPSAAAAAALPLPPLSRASRCGGGCSCRSCDRLRLPAAWRPRGCMRCCCWTRCGPALSKTGLLFSKELGVHLRTVTIQHDWRLDRSSGTHRYKHSVD